MLSEDKNAEAKEKDGASAGKAANTDGKRKEKKNSVGEYTAGEAFWGV